MTLTNSYQKVAEAYLGNTGYGDVYIRCYAKYNSQSVSANKTSVSVESRIYLSRGDFYSNSGTLGFATVDGETTTTDANRSYSAGETVVASKTKDVTHNQDGSKTVNVSSRWSSEPWGWGNTASANVDLPKIPRQSTINSFTGTDIKGDFSATYTATSQSYENRLRISIPGVQALQTYNNYVSGSNVTLNDSAIETIKNYTSEKTIVLGGVIETWSGSTKVGESEELTVTCTIKKPAKIRISGAWKEATPYVRVNGQWKEAVPYMRVSGTWKEEN